MSIRITVTGVFEAVELVAKKPNHYRILSVVSPKSTARKMLTQLGSVIDRLTLEIDDVVPQHMIENGYQLASLDDCRKAIDFIEQGGNVIVHCHAGVSRSTAMALGYLLKTNKNYRKAVDKLFQIRPSADPNTHILKLMCELLGKEDILSDIINYVRHKQNG